MRNEIYRIHIREVFIRTKKKRSTRQRYRGTNRDTVSFQTDGLKIREKGLALLLVNQQIHCEASATLFREIEPWFHVCDYVRHNLKANMGEAKPSAPAIFYEEAIDKPFTILYGWPDHQRVRCFSTFDPNYFARFRYYSLL